MNYSKEEYENLINNSPLFELDMGKDLYLYKSERLKLLELITDYYRLCIYKNKKLEDYSLTLMETATECIKYYQKEKGDFINILNYSMKRNFGIAIAKEVSDTYRQGITIGKQNEKLIRIMIAYAKSKNADLKNIEVQEKIAIMLNISIEKVVELLAMNENATAQFARIVNDDGEEIDLFDLKRNSSEMLENKMDEEDVVFEYLDKIEKAYNATQDRQKQVLSMLITAKFLQDFRETKFIEGRSFCDIKILEIFNRTGKVMTEKQIAAELGKLPTSISRTYNNFIKNVKKVYSIKI